MNINEEYSKASKQLMDIVWGFVNKRTVLDIGQTSFLLDKHDGSKVEINLLKDIDFNVEVIAQRVENFKKEILEQKGVNDFITAAKYLKVAKEMLFGEGNSFLALSKNIDQKFAIMTDLFETFTFSMVEKIWTVFVSIFTDDEMKKKYLTYTHNVNSENKIFGIYEIRFLVNNIYLYKVKGQSLEETWNLFLKKDIWKWLMEVREIRNRTMHATFTDIYISSDILKEKYNRIVGLFCIFISIMDKLSKVLSNTTVGMQKFVLNKDKPTIESIKRIKWEIENNQIPTLAQNEINIFNNFFNALLVLRNNYRNPENLRKANELIQNLNTLLSPSETQAYFNDKKILAYLKYAKQNNLNIFHNKDDILHEIRLLITNLKIANDKKIHYYNCLKRHALNTYTVLYNYVFENFNLDNINELN